ncbi:MAG: carboxylating nicotinate-nucleotide diphosphorylase [Prochlorothrix sp.]|nr:carboxylating nicotinate-nucleotide diphosphorylase [Prochlorothrix sp.]
MAIDVGYDLGHDVGLGAIDLWLVPKLREWLQEDLGRGDWSTQGLGASDRIGEAVWIAKEAGIVAGLPIAQRVFQILDPTLEWEVGIAEGQACDRGATCVQMRGKLGALLTGERVALNLAMRLSGVATMTRRFVAELEGLPTQFVDTRKTTPGLRQLEKYATRVGGALNHRMGLDDGVMLKDNHIAAAGGITAAIDRVRHRIPYPLSIEVETESLAQVQEAVTAGADIVMLDNMSLAAMAEAVRWIRGEAKNTRVQIEASGNVSVETIRKIALTGVDYISSSGPVTRSTWLDLSMSVKAQ